MMVAPRMRQIEDVLQEWRVGSDTLALMDGTVERARIWYDGQKLPDGRHVWTLARRREGRLVEEQFTERQLALVIRLLGSVTIAEVD